MIADRSDDAVVIRRAAVPADYRACQDAQRRAWGIVEDGYLVPIATLVGANLHGGLVLGAFRPTAPRPASRSPSRRGSRASGASIRN